MDTINLKMPSKCSLVSNKAVVAAALRRYLKREGLALSRELEKALVVMTANLHSHQTDLEADVFDAAQHAIDAQRRRVEETIRNILAM